MNNRRLVRIKAMQNLYSFYLHKQSIYQLTLQRLKRHLAPSILDPNPFFIDEKKQEILQKLLYNYTTGTVSDITIPKSLENIPNIKKIIDETILFYKKKIEDQLTLLHKNLLQESSQIHISYFLILHLLTEWISQSNQNLFINKLKKEQLFLNYYEKNFHSSLKIKNWYHDIIMLNENFKQYCANNNSILKIEKDKEIIIYLINNVIFKNEKIQYFFYFYDIKWEENSTIVHSMLLKTFQIDSKKQPKIYLNHTYLASQEANNFYQLLINESIKNEIWSKDLIILTSKKWNFDRIIIIDKLLILLALTEIIACSNIPTKISINEYIEIAKIYSTPQSGHFINGILGSILKKLYQEKKITKPFQ